MEICNGCKYCLCSYRNGYSTKYSVYYVFIGGWWGLYFFFIFRRLFGRFFVGVRNYGGSLCCAKRHNYPTVAKAKRRVSKVLREAVPSVLLIVIIIGGILTGLFTAIEASAIAVAYSLLISMFYYKTVKINDLPKMLKEAVLMSGTIMFLLATSSMMSFAMKLLQGYQKQSVQLF